MGALGVPTLALPLVLWPGQMRDSYELAPGRPSACCSEHPIPPLHSLSPRPYPPRSPSPLSGDHMPPGSCPYHCGGVDGQCLLKHLVYRKCSMNTSLHLLRFIHRLSFYQQERLPSQGAHMFTRYTLSRPVPGLGSSIGDWG